MSGQRIPDMIACQPLAKESGQNAHDGDSVRPKASAVPKKPERICVIVKGQSWEAPLTGKACSSLRHSHMTRSKVETLIADGKMEYVAGQQAGCPVWIPVAQFVKSRCWRKTMSVGDGPPVATMQLVVGG